MKKQFLFLSIMMLGFVGSSSASDGGYMEVAPRRADNNYLLIGDDAQSVDSSQSTKSSTFSRLKAFWRNVTSSDSTKDSSTDRSLSDVAVYTPSGRADERLYGIVQETEKAINTGRNGSFGERQVAIDQLNQSISSLSIGLKSRDVTNKKGIAFYTSKLKYFKNMFGVLSDAQLKSQKVGDLVTRKPARPARPAFMTMTSDQYLEKIQKARDLVAISYSRLSFPATEGTAEAVMGQQALTSIRMAQNGIDFILSQGSSVQAAQVTKVIAKLNASIEAIDKIISMRGRHNAIPATVGVNAYSNCVTIKNSYKDLISVLINFQKRLQYDTAVTVPVSSASIVQTGVLGALMEDAALENAALALENIEPVAVEEISTIPGESVVSAQTVASSATLPLNERQTRIRFAAQDQSMVGQTYPKDEYDRTSVNYRETPYGAEKLQQEEDEENFAKQFPIYDPLTGERYTAETRRDAIATAKAQLLAKELAEDALLLDALAAPVDFEEEMVVAPAMSKVNSQPSQPLNVSPIQSLELPRVPALQADSSIPTPPPLPDFTKPVGSSRTQNATNSSIPVPPPLPDLNQPVGGSWKTQKPNGTVKQAAGPATKVTPPTGVPNMNDVLKGQRKPLKHVETNAQMQAPLNAVPGSLVNIVPVVERQNSVQNDSDWSSSLIPANDDSENKPVFTQNPNRVKTQEEQAYLDEQKALNRRNGVTAEESTAQSTVKDYTQNGTITNMNDAAKLMRLRTLAGGSDDEDDDQDTENWD